MFNNKQRSRMNVLFTFVGLLLLLTSSMSFASIDVMDEDMEGFFGEATIPDFKNAIEGTESLNARDMAFLEGVEENRTAQRWYARFLIGRARVRLADVVNQSTGPDSSTLAITNPSA